MVSNPVYESLNVVQIREAEYLGSSMRNLVPGTTETMKEDIEGLRNLITSHNYLMRLIKTLNLGNDPKMLEKAEKIKNMYPGFTLVEIAELLWLEQLRGSIEIASFGGSFIEINVQANSPELALNITNTLTKIFIDESLQNEAGDIKGAMKFSSEQLNLFQKRLRESEDRLKQYKAQIVNKQFEEEYIVPSNLEQINAMLSSVEIDLRDAKDQLNYVENRINELGIFYYPPDTEELNRLKSRLADATLNLSKMMLKYSWDAPEVLRINLLIDELRGQIRSEIESNIRSQYFEEDASKLDFIFQKITIPMDIEFLEHKKAELSRLAKILKTNISNGPSRELNLDRLENEVQINKALVNTILEQSHGTEIEKALQKTSAEFKFKVVEPAQKPIKPIKPKPRRIFLLALVCGFFLGTGMISMIELVDHSFRNVDEVEKYLKLPVLGTIPPIEMEGGYKNWLKQNIGS